MRILLLIPMIFIGCASVNQTSKNIKNFTKCYIHKIPAPFWICYQSSFMAVGKVKSNKLSRLKQEEAYSAGVSDLIGKLQSKTKLLLRKLGVDNKKILEKVKNFVIINAIEDGMWYDRKNKMIYVKVVVDKDDFKKFLKNNLKVDNKKFEEIFDETF